MRTKHFLVFFVIFFAFNIFIASLLFSGTINLGSASYSDSSPSGAYTGPIYKTADLNNKPLPTNDWWSSLLFSQYSKNMYAFPLCYKADTNGLIIGTPDNIVGNEYGVTANFQSHIKVSAYKANTAIEIASSSTNVCGFTDWTVSAKWQDTGDATKFFKATMGQGLVFTYFDFQGDITPEIVLSTDFTKGYFDVYNNDNLTTALVGAPDINPIYGSVKQITTDNLAIKVKMDTNGSASSLEEHFYGIFLPEGTIVYLADYNTTGSDTGYRRLIISLPVDKRYMSVGIMNAISDLPTWKESAYNFVTDTKLLPWSIDESNSKLTNTYEITTDNIRTSASTDGGDTIMALFPHQYRNTSSVSFMSQTFPTLRGIMKLTKGKSFSTTLNFNGIVPFFDDNGGYDKTTLKQYLIDDESISLADTDLYVFGKKANSVANLIRVADKLGETATRDYFIDKLKTGLKDWFTYLASDSRYYYYNTNLNSLIAYPSGIYGVQNLNDHHFQYGYLVYASAILAFYDTDFKTNYGDMVESLIKDYACASRTDTKFPFLRNFSPYEGHSWASGFALNYNSSEDRLIGNDQESSSEAMNAWSGIYLWGLLNGKDDYKNLGIFGYTTENSAIENYWYNLNNIYPSGYNKSTIGILSGSKVEYTVWWDVTEADKSESVFGIQMLPLNPTSLYLAYNSDYVYGNYNSFKSYNGSYDAQIWKDIFWQYQSLYDPTEALKNHTASIDYQSTTKSFLYYWLHTMNKFGKVDTTVYADSSSFAVFDKNGTKTYCAFNPTNTTKRVEFKNRSNGISLGVLDVEPYSFGTTNVLFDPLHFSINKDTTVFTEDGTAIFVPADTFDEKVSILISSKTADESSIKSANNFIKNKSAQEFATKNGVFREFVAYNLTNQKVTKFNKSMTIKIPYKDDDNDGIIDDSYVSVSNLKIVYLNETTGEWEQLENAVLDKTNKTLNLSVPHLSIYGILKISNVVDLASVNIYPNPCYIQTTKNIKIDNLPNTTNVLDVYIYDITGKLMKKFDKNDLIKSYNGNYLLWDGLNTNGAKSASGVYLLFIKTNEGTKKDKLALIW
jgi:endoglucanase Acf2